MRSRKTLLAAIFMVLLVATVLSMVTVSVSQDKQPPEITVPPGRLGDELMYDVFDEHGEHRSTVRHQVGGVVDAYDGRLNPVKALELRSGSISPVDQLIDLDQRLTVQETVGRAFDSEWRNTTSYLRDVPLLPGLALQGDTLRLGDEVDWPLRKGEHVGADGGVSSAYVSVILAERTVEGRGMVYSDPDPGALSLPDIYTTNVSLMGSINDEFAYGIEVHAVESVSEDVRSLDITGTPERRVTATTYWFQHQRPYPVLIEQNVTTRWTDSEPTYRERTMELSSYLPGGEAVPWGEDDDASTTVEMARSNGLHPTDGHGTELPYPLSQAIRDVENEMLDPEWVQWREAESDPVMVSATMHPGSNSWTGQNTIEWRLIFMGSEDAYEVRTERSPDSPIAIVEGRGVADVPQGDYQTEKTKMTIAAMLDIWHNSHGPADQPPTFFHWGLINNEWTSARFCVLKVGNPSLEIMIDPQDLLRQAYVGDATFGPCHNEDLKAQFHAMVMNITLPGLSAYHESVSDYWAKESRSPSSSAGRSAQQPEPRTNDEQLVVGPPDFERGATVGVPLMVLLLTAYYFPALQFATAKTLLFIPAFSRLKKSQVLGQQGRERLHSLIQKNPGISSSKLKKETGLGWGTIVYHLAVMEREGLVASRIEGRHRRFFVADEVAPSERASLAVLANERTHECYTRLIDAPGLATGELAHQIGVSTPGAVWHLKRLEENGLVERKRDGRYVRYYPVQGFRPYDPREAVEVA